MEQKTPLYDVHVELGGKIVPFAGFLLPIQYSDITQEHMAVRERVGLFDVSHMGEVMLTGSDALATLQALLPNDFTNLKPGRVRYSPMLNENGGIVDDLIVYCFSPEKYKLVVNASNIEKDVNHMKKYLVGNTVLENISDKIGQVAIQGPKSKEVIASLLKEEEIPTVYYSFIDNVKLGNINVLISRTGYTGSFGYEIYCDAADTTYLWKTLMEAGKTHGIEPCALGCRDTLRIEAGMPLYGQEMTDHISPLETGLDFAVKLGKTEDFVGKKALESAGQPKKTRVGLKVIGRGIVRGESNVLAGDSPIGVTTSGTLLPYLNAAYAMAIIDKEHAAAGTKLDVDVRGRKIAVEIVELPFFKL